MQLRRVKSSELTTQTYQSHTEIDGIYFVVAVTIPRPGIWLDQVGTDTNWSHLQSPLYVNFNRIIVIIIFVFVKQNSI